MSFTVGALGINTPEAPETRYIIPLEVNYNGNTYNWQWYMPYNTGMTITDFVNSQANNIQADIDSKEAQWAALGPNPTRTITDSITQQQTNVPIDKSEIVKPDFPDYYALRRSAYPPLSDQIAALIGPNANPSTNILQQQIAAVKAQYPKPSWMTSNTVSANS
jgi:hypothetical protein